MRRKQTRITVWPAITDLMTAILVIAFLTGVVAAAYNYAPDDLKDIHGPEGVEDPLEIEKLRRLVDSLTAVVDDLLEDDGKVGTRSCIGEERENLPNSLMTIRVTPDGYYIAANYIVLNKPLNQSETWRKLLEVVDRYHGQELGKPDMTLFAEALYQLGEDWPNGKCRFFPTFENGGVSQDALYDAWKFLDIRQYFGGLTNPGSLLINE